MKKSNLIKKGKNKLVWSADAEGFIVLEFCDSEDGGLESATNNNFSNAVFKMLEEEGVRTHFVRKMSEFETIVKKVDIIKIEVVVRNAVAGGLVKRLGLDEGERLKSTVLEYFYKNPELNNPLINDYHIAAMDLASLEEMLQVANLSFKINSFLSRQFKSVGMDLVDFKLEFGRLPDGTVVLADEISPRTCRLNELATGKRLTSEEAYNLLISQE